MQLIGITTYVCVILCIFVFLCDILLPSGVINDDDDDDKCCERSVRHFILLGKIVTHKTPHKVYTK